MTLDVSGGADVGRLPMILQTEAAECGLACLAMIAGYHGLNTDLATLRGKLAVSLKGMNLVQLMEAAQSLGLAGRPVRLELDEMAELQTPCLLHWDLNHFVVLKCVRRGQVIVHDPAVGLRRMSFAQAGQHFTGVALELSPTPDFERGEKVQRVRLRDLFGRVVGGRRKFVQVLAISLGVELCALMSPLYVQWVVDHALLSADKDLVTLLALGFALVALVHVGLSALRSWVVLNASTGIGLQWSVNVFSHLLRLPQSYFEKRHLGDVVSRFDAIGAIQKTLTTGFVEAVLDGVMVLVTLTMMMVYSPMLTGVALLSVALYALVRVLAYSPLRRATEEQIVLAAKQQSTFLESVRGIQAIKLFGRESQRLAVWQNRLVDTTNRVLKTQRFMIGYRLALGLLGAVESILVVWIGAQLILGGVFSIGMLFAFVAYKGVFSARMSSLIDKAVELRMLRLQGERLADIVLTSREANGEPEGMGDTSLPSLCLDAVSFRYSELDPWVLRETRLTIPAGAAVAIVGPSGCGKTTLAKLLLGLLRPTAGRIAVQGRERSLSDAGHLRYITGAVMQDDHLFTGSLADNIAFFDPRPDLEKIERVARLACIHDDIRHMAMGYHTLVGDMGTALSGGQRQRILLARALYREPKILVLDEATSHLDVALERAINDAVRGLKMTRIVIAHRPETIAACDLVVELPSVNQVEPPALAAP